MTKETNVNAWAFVHVTMSPSTGEQGEVHSKRAITEQSSSVYGNLKMAVATEEE